MPMKSAPRSVLARFLLVLSPKSEVFCNKALPSNTKRQPEATAAIPYVVWGSLGLPRPTA